MWTLPIYGTLTLQKQKTVCFSVRYLRTMPSTKSMCNISIFCFWTDYTVISYYTLGSSSNPGEYSRRISSPSVVMFLQVVCCQKCMRQVIAIETVYIDESIQLETGSTVKWFLFIQKVIRVCGLSLYHYCIPLQSNTKYVVHSKLICC